MSAAKLVAAAGVASSAHGGNPTLTVIIADSRWRELGRATRVAMDTARCAATLRLAATLYERLSAISYCAICTEERDGQIHLEFGTGATIDEEQTARRVLQDLAVEFNAAQEAQS